MATVREPARRFTSSLEAGPARESSMARARAGLFVMARAMMPPRPPRWQDRRSAFAAGGAEESGRERVLLLGQHGAQVEDERAVRHACHHGRVARAQLLDEALG